MTIIKIIAYATGAAFVLTMLGLTVYLVVTPATITQTCSNSNSQSWIVLTIAAGALGAGLVGFAASEEARR